MVETVVSVGLPVDEKMDIKKNRIKPDTLTGKEKRICFVTGTHGDELEGQYVCCCGELGHAEVYDATQGAFF